MGHRQRERGFSIIEVLVALAIAAILMSMSYSALSKGKTVSKETTCLNNLKHIAVALNLYYNRYSAYPPEDLRDRLIDYAGGNPSVFICPVDEDPCGDSYSRFYIARAELGSQGYICGCPRHVGESSAITLFSSASTHVLEGRKIRWNGQLVDAGATVGSGVLTFEDGSNVAIPSGMMVRLIQSFRTHDGRFYSLIGVDINEQGVLDIEVTPGSRFEVITPAAIAGVQGTRFKLNTFVQGDQYCVKVDVTEGTVSVQPLWDAAPAKPIEAGQTAQVSIPRVTVAKILIRKWLSRRVILADDPSNASLQDILNSLLDSGGSGTGH